MKAKELAERFRAFSVKLEEHRALWKQSLSDSWMADGIVRNHDSIFEQQRELHKMLAVLNSYINQFALTRTIGGYGQAWDIFGSSATDDHPTRKSRSLQEAIQQVDGIIARVELIDPNREVPEDPSRVAPPPETVDAALQDVLVPLQNRRGLEQEFGGRAGELPAGPMCFVFFDIDNFKQVNDEQGGHDTGDEALISIAQVAGACVSGKGSAFRLGGDEFVMLLPNHSLQEGLAVAERLRREVNAVPRTKRQLTLSVSVGVAVYPKDGGDFDALKTAADAALYQAKAANRNVVRYYGEAEPVAAGPREPDRREPDPGGLSADERTTIRESYFRSRVARCPRDQALLNVQDATAMGQSTRSIHVWCPLCGLQEDLD